MIIGAFEARVASMGSAPALVVEDGRRLNYTELDHVAGALGREISRCLAAIGLATEKVVGGENDTPLVSLTTARDVGLITSVLGILKAGAAYVPVDPSFPAARQAYILSHSRCSLAVMDEESHAAAMSLGGAALPPTIVIKASTGAIVQAPSFIPRPELVPQMREQKEAAAEELLLAPSQRQEGGLAYVLYTSGSTGNPKGVCVTQAGVINIVDWFAQQLDVSSGKKVLGLTTFCFDISVLEMFMPLLHGGTLVLAFSSTQKDPFRLLDILQEHCVDVLQATPTTFEMMLAAGWRGSAGLDLLVGGEAWRPALLPMVAGCRSVRNVYGPTETTIWSSSYTVSAAESQRAEGPTPIGQPISLTTFYLAAEDVDPVSGPLRLVDAAGEQEGELVIGGAGVARGYLHAPELTTGRFLPNPWGEGRVYRTGDLVRRRGDGSYVFVRRMDDQVKIGGYRIELAEVEAAAARHAGVVRAVAQVRANRIVLYVELQGAPAEIAPCALGGAWPEGQRVLSAVKAEAALSLPHYMVPRAWVLVGSAQWPLTPNGKLDKKLLPDPTEEAEEEDKADARSVQGAQDGSIRTVASARTEGTEGTEGIESARTKANGMERLLGEAIFRIRGRHIKPTATLASIGVDSLGAVLFLKYLSDTLQLRVEAKQLYEPGVTVRALAQKLHMRLAQEKPEVARKLGLEADPNKLQENKAEAEAKGEGEGEGEGDEDALEEWERQQEEAFEECIGRNRLLHEGLRGVFTFLVLWEHFHRREWNLSNTFVADTSLFVLFSGLTTVLQWRETPKYRFMRDEAVRKVSTAQALEDGACLDQTVKAAEGTGKEAEEVTERELIPRTPFNVKAFILSRFVGVFPIMWVAIAVNAPVWYWSWLFYTNDGHKVFETPEEKAWLRDEKICTVLYVVALNCWYRTLKGGCRFHGPNTILYASIIWGVFIMYAIARKSLEVVQDVLLRSPRVSPALRGLVVRLMYNRPHDWTEALYMAAAWLCFSVALTSSLLASSMKNSLSFLPHFLLGASAANVLECFHYVRFKTRRATQLQQQRQQEQQEEEEARGCASGSSAAAMDEAIALEEGTAPQRLQDNLAPCQLLGSSSSPSPPAAQAAAHWSYSPEMDRALHLAWRFLPDMLSVTVGIVMSTLTPDLDIHDENGKACWLMYCGVPLLYTTFGVVSMLQEGDDTRNLSRLFLENRILGGIGYASFPIYLFQMVALNTWFPLLQQYSATGVFERRHPIGTPFFFERDVSTQIISIILLIVISYGVQWLVQDIVVGWIYSKCVRSAICCKSKRDVAVGSAM